MAFKSAAQWNAEKEAEIKFLQAQLKIAREGLGEIKRLYADGDIGVYGAGDTAIQTLERLEE